MSDVRKEEVDCHAKETPEADEECLIFTSDDVVLVVEESLVPWFERLVEIPVTEVNAELV